MKHNIPWRHLLDTQTADTTWTTSSGITRTTHTPHRDLVDTGPPPF